MNRLLIVAAVPNTFRAFLLPFAHYFQAQGWRVDAMAKGISTCDRCSAAFDRVWDVEFARNPLNPRNLLMAPPKIREVVMRENYDIVHVHMAVAGFVTRYALKALRRTQGLQMIYTAHGFNFYQGEMPLKNAIFLTLEKLAGTWTDHLIVMNREDEIAAKRYSILPAQRVNYMPGIGVDQEHYNPATVSVAEVMRFRQELKIQPETPLFLAIAEFIPRKRHRDMLNAFAKIDRPNAHFAFAGEGVLLPQMQQLACQLGVQNRVHFLGFRQDIPVLIRAAIATVMASEQEGLPRSVMESLCLEIPAIGTKIRGIQELLENGCGLMVPVGEVEGLAQAMVWSLDHPQEMQEMGKRGRELMVDCDLQQILKRHHKLYTQAIDRRSAS